MIEAIFFEDEILTDIKGYEDLYGITNYGRVLSYRKDKFLNVRKSSTGYDHVCLSKKGVCKDFWVHRLVAEAFIPNPDELPVVNHKDENPLNNHVSNLEWCTQKYNINYGTAKQRAAQKIKKPVYCVELDKTFESGKAAAEELGITAQGICVVCGNPFRMAGGYHWEYAR